MKTLIVWFIGSVISTFVWGILMYDCDKPFLNIGQMCLVHDVPIYGTIYKEGLIFGSRFCNKRVQNEN